MGRLTKQAGAVLTTALILAACSGGDSGDGAAETTVPASTTTTSPVLVGSGSRVAGDETGDGDGTSVGEPLDFALPLTGTAARAVGDAYLPALAVKIDNVDAARPQAGINQADIVVEEMVEGGLTRLLAVFHSEMPEMVGPVRSARSTDVPILRSLGRPLFAWTGANTTFAETIRSLSIVDVGLEALPDRYTELAGRSAPSHLFVDPVDLFVDVVGQGGPPPPLLSYAEIAADLTEPRPADGVTVAFGTTQIGFAWDQSIQRWARTQDGTAHVDTDGIVVAPTNVIIQFVEYADTGLTDSNGQSIPEAVLEGAGEAWFFTGGQVTDGRWEDDGFDAAPRYSARSIIFGFRPGPTWIILAPAGSAELIG